MAYSLRHELDPLTGKYILTPVDDSVPGATTSQPAVPQAAIDQATAPIAQEQQQAAATQLTDEQKAQQDQAKKVEQAQLAKLKVKEQELKARGKAREAGVEEEMVLQPEDMLPQDRPMPGDRLMPGDPEAEADAAFGLGAVTPETESILAGAEAGAEGRVPLQGQALEDAANDVAAEKTEAIGEHKGDLTREALEAQAKHWEDLAEGSENLENFQKEEYEPIRKKLEDLDQKAIELIEGDITPPSASVVNLIGVFLGGLVAPMRGGKNTALQALQTRLQRETNTLIENRRTKLAGTRARKGILQDKFTQVQQEVVAKNIMMGQKLNAVEKFFTAEAQKEHLPEIVRLEAEKNAAEIRRQKGISQKNASAAMLKVLANQRATELRTKAKGIKGSGKPRAKVGDAITREEMGPNSIYVNLKRKGMRGEEVYEDKSLRESTVMGGFILTDHEGNRHSGYVNMLGTTEASSTAKSINDLNVVREEAQAILATAKNVKGWDKMTFGALAQTDEGRLIVSQYTRLMVSIKDTWGLGAIQAPDMFLLDRSTGGDPTKPTTILADWVTGTAIEKVLENFQESEQEKIKHRILREAGLSGSSRAKVELIQPDVTERFRRKAELTPAESAEEISLNLEEFLDIRNEEGPGVVPAVSISQFENEIQKLVDTWEAGIKESANKKSGGQVSGKAQIRLKQLRKKAKRPEDIAAIDHGLYIMDPGPGGKRAVERRAKNKERKENQLGKHGTTGMVYQKLKDLIKN